MGKNNATKFTMDYLLAIKSRLKIELNEIGVPVYIPERIQKADFYKLKDDLSDIWVREEDARNSIMNVEDAFIQSTAYGLVNDFDLLLKTGYLLGDRIILWDFIYGRLLNKNNIANMDHMVLGVIANNLISAIELAKNGNLVILPHPLEWHNESKLAFKEIASKVAITPSLLGMVCSLSVAKELNTQPYTVLESEVDYKKTLHKHDKYYSSLKEVNAKYYYETLMAGLLSARLLSDIRFEEGLKKPLSEYHRIIADRKDFYSRYKSQLSTGGLLESEQNLKIFSDNLEKDILSWNARIIKAADTFGEYGATVSGILGLVAAAGVATVPVGIAAAVVGLSSTLSSQLAKNKSDKNIVTAVFSKLLI